MQTNLLRSSARQLQSHLQRQCRRHASSEHGHSEPKNESFGSGFFITIAAIPAAIAVFSFTRADADGNSPYFTRRIINTYENLSTKWTRRNDLHTQMLEQAAADKHLFLNENTMTTRRSSLAFPESFNVGSPWNVPAGSYADISQVVKKYEKESYAKQEQKLQQLRENKVPVESDFERFTRGTPAAGGGG